MIRRETSRPNGCRGQPAVQSARRLRSSRRPPRSPRKPRHRTSMPGSRATDLAGLDVKDLMPRTPLSAIDTNALAVQRMPGVRDHDKLRSVRRMTNDVECGDLIKVLWWDGQGLCLLPSSWSAAGVCGRRRTRSRPTYARIGKTEAALPAAKRRSAIRGA